MERPPEKQLPKYRTIINRINFLRKSLLIHKLIHQNDIIEEVNTNIDGRQLELCDAALRLFNSNILTRGDKEALPEVKDALSHFLRKKGELDKKTIESVIYDVINALFKEIDSDNGDALNEGSLCCKKETSKDILGVERTFYILSYDLICKRIMNEVEGNLVSQRTFESAEFGKTSHDSLISACRSVFGAKDSRLGRGKDKKKALKFDKNEVIESGQSFDVVSDIKISDKPGDGIQIPPEDYRITSMWDKWGVPSKVGTSGLILGQNPTIEGNNRFKMSR